MTANIASFYGPAGTVVHAAVTAAHIEARRLGRLLQESPRDAQRAECVLRAYERLEAAQDTWRAATPTPSTVWPTHTPRSCMCDSGTTRHEFGCPEAE